MSFYDPNNEVNNYAATIIQKNFRGYITRLIIAE